VAARKITFLTSEIALLSWCPPIWFPGGHRRLPALAGAICAVRCGAQREARHSLDIMRARNLAHLSILTMMFVQGYFAHSHSG